MPKTWRTPSAFRSSITARPALITVGTSRLPDTSTAVGLWPSLPHPSDGLRRGEGGAGRDRLFSTLSPRGDRVDVLDTVRQPRLVPRTSAVQRSENLTPARGAEDPGGIPGIERHGHHRAPGLHAVVEAR